MEKVYEGYLVYGPYLSKKDNRLRIALRDIETRKTKFMSYPKYIMEVYLNRYLLKNETVDHIDGNPLNNSVSNLRILDRKEHCSQDALRNRDLKVNCIFCNNLFTIKGSALHSRNRFDRKQSGYFCSRTCSGKYGALIQNNRIKPFTNIERKRPSKYKVKSAQLEITDVEAG